MCAKSTLENVRPPVFNVSLWQPEQYCCTNPFCVSTGIVDTAAGDDDDGEVRGVGCCANWTDETAIRRSGTNAHRKARPRLVITLFSTPVGSEADAEKSKATEPVRSYTK